MKEKLVRGLRNRRSRIWVSRGIFVGAKNNGEICTRILKSS